jgi:hypothetical protein
MKGRAFPLQARAMSRIGEKSDRRQVVILSPESVRGHAASGGMVACRIDGRRPMAFNPGSRMGKTRWLGWFAAAALTIQGMPALGQSDGDDGDAPQSGELAALLLAVGGAVAGVLYREDDLRNRIRGSLDGRGIAYSDAQLRSLSQQASQRLRAAGDRAGSFTICAEGQRRGRPCLRVILQERAAPTRLRGG